jgi:hypothetical protein
VSADTHTSTPRHGVPSSAVADDERYAGTDHGPHRGRLATADPAPLAAPAGNSPLAWAQDSAVLPVLGRPQPRLRQMLGVCGWAAVLGALGLVVGIRGFWADLMDLAPSWYEPTMIGVGLVGIALTVGAFATVHRRRTPYVLLTAATGVLAYAILLTATTL